MEKTEVNRQQKSKALLYRPGVWMTAAVVLFALALLLAYLTKNGTDITVIFVSIGGAVCIITSVLLTAAAHSREYRTGLLQNQNKKDGSNPEA